MRELCSPEVDKFKGWLGDKRRRISAKLDHFVIPECLPQSCWVVFICPQINLTPALSALCPVSLAQVGHTEGPLGPWLPVGFGQWSVPAGNDTEERERWGCILSLLSSCCSTPAASRRDYSPPQVAGALPSVGLVLVGLWQHEDLPHLWSSVGAHCCCGLGASLISSSWVTPRQWFPLC